MERFNIRCPDHFPMRCNLSPVDMAYLMSKEKYKAFLIFQYNDQDPWLLPTLERYFSERTWRLFNAGAECGTGTKFCNVCRYALASDFGIASLTPLNNNVFQETGLMHGLQKQLLFILNPDRLRDIGKLPFDIDDQIYIEHRNKEELISGLDNKIPLVLDKVQLLSGFESDKRSYVKDKLEQISEEARGILKILVFEGSIKFYGRKELEKWMKIQREFNPTCLNELFHHRFIITETVSGGSRTINYVQLNPSYAEVLKELLWE